MKPFSKTILLSVLAFAQAVHANDDLSGYHTMHEAITTTVRGAKPDAIGLTAYLGVAAEKRDGVGLLISEIATDSSAAKAGLMKGDAVTSLDDTAVKTADDLRALIQTHQPGDNIKLMIQRENKTQNVTATLDALSKPLSAGDSRAVLGVRMGAPTDIAGIPIVFVTAGSPAGKAGLRSGDVILKVNDAELGEGLSLTDKLSEFKRGENVEIIYQRGDKRFSKTITLAADASDSVPVEEQRNLKTWKKGTYRMALIGVEFADVKHDTRVPLAEWEKMFFSLGNYTDKNATGQNVHGSIADYYAEASCGKLRVEGKVFDWVTVPKKRAEYNQARGNRLRISFYSEMIEAVLARDGAEALKDFDGIGILYAGDRLPEANRSSLLWPHRSNMMVKGKQWPYVIIPAGAERMANISTMCHETGHILGLPDLYARPENPGSEGVGRWCIMSNQNLGGQPQHFCAWSKEQLGWLTPVVIDPSVKQKLILGPVEGSTSECCKVLVKPDGSEYFLLENRRKTGFDASLSAEGLLIWRVVANRPILEESHGITGPSGPRVHLNMVPYPRKTNNAFTPYTTPSSRSQLGGGAPVFITNIRQLADGRVAFEIGQEFE